MSNRCRRRCRCRAGGGRRREHLFCPQPGERMNAMTDRNVHRVRRNRRERKDDAVEPGRDRAARTGPERRTRARGGLVRVARDAVDPRSLPGRPQPGAGAPRGAAAVRRARDPAGGRGRDPQPLARRRRHHRSIPVHGGGAGAADSPPARRDDSRDHRRRGRRRVARHGGPRRRRPVGRARPPQGREADGARAAAVVAQGAGGKRPRAAPAGGLSLAGGRRPRALDRRRQHRCRSGRAGGPYLRRHLQGARAGRAGGGRQ